MIPLFSIVEDCEQRNKLESLYNEYSLYIYKVAYQILKDKYLAQDAVQEAFISIIKNINKIDRIKSNKTKAFLVIIIRNISINIYNKRKKQPSVSFEEIDDLSEAGPSVEEVVISNDSFLKIADMMKRMNPLYSDILTFKYYFNYKDEEISSLLNISPENTRTRLHRARKSLLLLLSENQGVINI